MSRREREDVVDELESVLGNLREWKKRFDQKSLYLKSKSKLLDETRLEVERLRKRIKQLRKAKIVSFVEWKDISKTRLPRALHAAEYFEGLTKGIYEQVQDLSESIDWCERNKKRLTEELDSFGQLIHLEAYRNGRV